MRYNLGTMIPAGYSAKRVMLRPDSLKADGVADIFSVSDCMSERPVDPYLNWKCNAFWLFDSPAILREAVYTLGDAP